MITITAVIAVKPGTERKMRDALLSVAHHVKDHEPGTAGFFLSQDEKDPSIFTTYERFIDRAAMDKHNNSAHVAHFFEVAKPLLARDVVLHIAQEYFAKP